MMRSLYAGVTGLSTHQTRMDVIGNNIANVNTVGFKTSTTTFKDLYSETLNPAAAPTADGSTGGVNPTQVGLGVTLNSITTVMTPGAPQYTGSALDIAISGDGFFAVGTSTGTMYTRAGNFTLDTEGNLVTSSGAYVQVIAPIESVQSRVVVEDVFTDTLFIPGGSIEGPPPGSEIQSGVVSAEFASGGTQGYTFEFVPDPAGRLEAGTMASYFAPSYSGSFTLGIGTTIGGTVESSALAQMYIGAATENNDGGGELPISFRAGATANEILMFMGEVEVASANYTGGGGTISFGTFTLNIGGGTAPADAAALMSGLNEMADEMPDIVIDEVGQWNLVDSGTGDVVEENVRFTATEDINGQISNGEIMFQTQDYGTYRLSVNNEDIKSSLGISDVFNSATTPLSFEVITADQNYAVYTSPTGTIDPAALTNFQIDADKYTSMAIDSTGAIVAQIKEDSQVIIDGEIVEMQAGERVVLGYIPLAVFNNAAGLEKVGDNLYSVSSNSGEAMLTMPGTGNAGAFSVSSLEMSNVDLSEEMVSMIVTQRGFQANSRIITTTDSMLEEIVNLKR